MYQIPSIGTKDLYGGSVNPLAEAQRELMITLLMLIYVFCTIVQFTIDTFYSIRLPDTEININVLPFSRFVQHNGPNWVVAPGINGYRFCLMPSYATFE